MPNNKLSPSELIIGIVSPLGSNRDLFIKKLKDILQPSKFNMVDISITKLLMGNIDNLKIPKSLSYYLKMQICSALRSGHSNGILIKLVLDEIKNQRKKNKNERCIYIIDQLKNENEYKVLSHIYGLSYIQISLFSNQIERDNTLKCKFNNDVISPDISTYKKECRKIVDNIKIKTSTINNKYIDNLIDSYVKDILPDTSHNLMKKDFTDIDVKYHTTKSGQQVSELFHKSHYFVNLDLTENEISGEANKFVNLLLGLNKEYPTQDEFGMSLAYQASVRSNFPGDRHVGAAIISEYGEVISIASIRAPSKSSNTTRMDESLIETGYKTIHDKVDDFKAGLDNLTSNKNTTYSKENALFLSQLKDFLGGIIDFHPCTHAEIAAIIDAAKLGVSVRNSTLYSTTFPCHLCAKDIINAGIKRVVYLEAYPKSKNKELYPNLIAFDPKFESELVPFNFYWGMGPKRFSYAYSLENVSKIENEIPLIRFESWKYYCMREDEILSHFKKIINKKCNSYTTALCKLLHNQNKD